MITDSNYSDKFRLFLSIAVLIVFAAATVWINYQVKVNVQGGGKAGTVYKMGNVKLGDPAPDFTVMDLSNRMVSLSDFRGKKVILLDFWATWCGPCRMEMVDLQSLQDKFKDKNFEIVCLNQGEEADQIKGFISQRKYDFQVLLDSGEVSAKYGVQAIPSLVLIGRDGVIKWLQVGYAPEDSQLEQKIESLTAK